MAGLENLVPYLYHEKQQAGSMLCAQHALNNLLQGNYFTAPDLSDIARGLDHLEESYEDSNTGSSSTNMDDTGFFSVQVLDNALKVWGLNLVRWRSQDMRSYQDHPHTQLAFILNLEQHWFTLRRFGTANSNVDLDEGNGHWFNLNSFLPAPEWVGKLYLGMVLQQSEEEGYSVFAVTQADPNVPLGLPRTEADAIASTLAEPNSASRANSRRPPAKRFGESPSTGDLPEDLDLEDEDYELQVALQASLMSQNDEPVATGSGSSSRLPPFQPQQPLSSHPDDLDPVAAGMERNRILLQRMRDEQEFAQREVWSEANLAPEEQIALNERREQRRKQEEEEENELQRAIAESQALAKRQTEESIDGHKPGKLSTPERPFTSRDDDDPELQAALRESLEQAGPSSKHSDSLSEMDDVESESVISDSMSTATETPQAVAPTLEEVRRRRLAKFDF
ncbi:hypothetical protein M413DRAFT_446263 [Hebeloma cylindrosporum]|uniref:ubiquitinyl hydrolase 1 n=1 Tax=Hebeloma cylindrosporum TaxID=76867 RepID=A0A0C3C985_HEBCY|nr:hypothetical protein M413DRAFT_446263 [Hebeloma cylindrosporum h7]